MYLFRITLFIISMVISHGNNYYKKCCKSGEYMAEHNSVYECVGYKSMRLGILTNETDFLKQNLDGECVDLHKKDIFTFDISGGKVAKKVLINEKYFPKCCPLNYHYNPILHACQQWDDVQYDLLEKTFVKVGLPECKVILDHVFNDLEAREMVAKTLSQNPGSYCLDKTETNLFVLRECKENTDICDDMKCIKKCCPDGQSFINGSQCFDTYVHGLNLSTFSVVDNPADSYVILSNRICPKIYMMPEKRYTFHLDQKGVFKYWTSSSRSFTYEDVNRLNSYCIEHAKTKTFDGYHFFRCVAKKSFGEKFDYTLWPKILSCIFLLLTITVYVLIDETKNMFGKILINYCTALLIQYGVLTYMHLSLYPSAINCALRGFTIIFFATAVFCWSNVICYDIWRTFGSTRRSFGEYPGNKTIKKLILYFLYGWGLPVIITLNIYLLHNYKVLPDSIQPLLMKKKCFFNKEEGNYGEVVFFHLPHLIIQSVNTVLFIKTVMYCLKVKNAIDKINDTTKDDKNKNFRKDKERLFLILKLSAIMGMSFMFEVVSAFFDMGKMGAVPKYIEIVWDVFNCLQGVFIFMIFICKKKVYRNLLRKFKIFVPRSRSSSSFHTQATTVLSGTSNKLGNSNIGKEEF